MAADPSPGQSRPRPRGSGLAFVSFPALRQAGGRERAAAAATRRQQQRRQQQQQQEPRQRKRRRRRRGRPSSRAADGAPKCLPSPGAPPPPVGAPEAPLLHGRLCRAASDLAAGQPRALSASSAASAPASLHSQRQPPTRSSRGGGGTPGRAPVASDPPRGSGSGGGGNGGGPSHSSGSGRRLPGRWAAGARGVCLAAGGRSCRAGRSAGWGERPAGPAASSRSLPAPPPAPPGSPSPSAPFWMPLPAACFFALPGFAT